MNITNKENDLFDKWIDSNYIVRDGLIDETEYFKSKKKILVIMKETYGGLNEWNNDLRNFLREGGRSQTWNNIVRWTSGLQNLEKDTNQIWADIKDINQVKRTNYLKSIASINLKKKPGGATTVAKELTNEARLNINLLKEQVSLYNPDIVLCGGKQVANLVQEMKLFGEINFDTYDTVRLARSDNKLIISYFHPQVRGKGSGKEELFKNLITKVKQFESSNK